jgi:hypothetical protein
MLVVLTGCGYTPLSPEEAFPQDVATVAVAAVANTTDRTDLSSSLTAALVRTVEIETPYRIADIGTADTLLEVTIREVIRDSDLRSRETGFSQIESLLIVADVTWTDLRDGTLLLSLEGVLADRERYPTFGEGLPAAARLASDALAREITDEMAGRW